MSKLIQLNDQERAAVADAFQVIYRVIDAELFFVRRRVRCSQAICHTARMITLAAARSRLSKIRITVLGRKRKNKEGAAG